MSFPAARTLVWVAQVLAVYLRFQPLVTMALIGCLAIKEIAQVLVFFVPIKVIILAGSDHLPPYLVKFIGPEHRESLILALAIGTVMLFVVTFLLDALAGSLANAGGLRALNRANLLARASREQVEAPRYYTQFCRVAANLIFVLVAFAILGVLQAHLLLVLVGLIGLQYGLTVLLFYLSNPILPHTAAYWVKHNLGNYLGLLSSINLLAGFLVLLAPFLSCSGANILIALLSFLLLRRPLMPPVPDPGAAGSCAAMGGPSLGSNPAIRSRGTRWPLRFSMRRKCASPAGSTKLTATPGAPARAVRPMRWV